MAATTRERKSLLSSAARVQAPWVKAKIGDYTFGVYDRKEANASGTKIAKIQYPNYITSLTIDKVNGQVNQYSLQLTYPVRPQDDPNFIEKVLSSVSSSRQIVFSYGDSFSPNFSYKNEEALITGVTQSFDLERGTISYTINAVSSAALATTGHFTFVNTATELKKPSDEIKRVFRANSQYGLQNIFVGMDLNKLDSFITSDDQAVILDTKTNISPLDYVIYLVGCMVPAGASTSNVSNDIYILNIHDETFLDQQYSDNIAATGPYFTVTRVNSLIERAEAYEIDIGYPTSNIVLAFAIDQQENYSLFYEYNEKLTPEHYVQRLGLDGKWENTYAPQFTSGNAQHSTGTSDAVWFSKMTKYPISATVKLQGLLRPATLMQYVRLNVIFPGGNKHVSSGLYIVTKQRDEIGTQGYFTTLSVTRIAD